MSIKRVSVIILFSTYVFLVCRVGDSLPYDVQASKGVTELGIDPVPQAGGV